MIKAFVLLFNLLGIFFCWLFFPNTVTVSQIAPSSAQINNSVLVQVTINKGDLNGAGNFTEQLPAGFNAVPIDDEGAQTSFDGNTIAFSWNSLPTDGILNISFRIDITSLAAAQNYVLTGKFLYTANNQKSEADCAPTNISITTGSMAQGGTTPQTSVPQNTGMVQTSPAPQPSAPSTAQTSAPQNTATVPGRVFVVRQFSPTTITPKTDTKVTLTIHKANITGFAKIEDSIPPGFTASPGDLNGASFTFVDTRAKFVWDNIPSDSVVAISYRIAAISNVPGTHIVIGNFSYLDHNNPNSISIGSTVFNSSVTAGYDINKEKNASTPPVTTTPPTTELSSATANVTPSNANSSSANTTPVVSNPPAATNSTPSSSQADANPATTAASASSVTYKVQVLALHNPVGSSYFSNRKIKEHVTTESDGGLTKYTIGNYTDYKLVKEARDNLRGRGFDGAFVVTYKSGVRLSLEDAMKITH